MITNRRTSIATDPRGKIKTGIKAMTKEGKEYPKSTDYFVITEFPELVKMYGEKPQKLLVMPPSDTIESVFDDTFVLYGGGDKEKPGTKVRTCDGTRCMHRRGEQVTFKNEDGSNGSAVYQAGEETDCICTELGLFIAQDKDIKKKACKYSMYAKFYIANPNTGKVESPLPFLFETHSQNSGSAIHDALENMAVRTAMLTDGTPKLNLLKFQLEVRMVEGKNDAKQKFPIWHMTPLGTISDITDRLIKVAQLMGRSEDVKKLTEGRAKNDSEGGLTLFVQKVTRPELEEPPIDGGEPPTQYLDKDELFPVPKAP